MVESGCRHLTTFTHPVAVQQLRGSNTALAAMRAIGAITDAGAEELVG